MNSLRQVFFSICSNSSLLSVIRTNRVLVRFSSSNVPSAIDSKFLPSKRTDDLTVFSSDIFSPKTKPDSALDECLEDVSHYAPYQVPSYNLAKFVNKSQILQELVKLGVNLSVIERNPNITEAILKLTLEDIKPYLQFLTDLGVHSDSLGPIISKAPMLLLQDLNNLHVRINYLISKKFSNDDIVRIVTVFPRWLLASTQHVDELLGFWQSTFSLTGHEVRSVATRRPRLVRMDRNKAEEIIFTLKEEIGLTLDEMKKILLTRPRVFTTGRRSLLERWEVVREHMKLDHVAVADNPDLLLHRASRLKARHLFLEKVGRAQYNPAVPNYISPLRMLEGDDAHFALQVAGASVATYNLFLKTL